MGLGRDHLSQPRCPLSSKGPPGSGRVSGLDGAVGTVFQTGLMGVIIGLCGITQLHRAGDQGASEGEGLGVVFAGLVVLAGQPRNFIQFPGVHLGFSAPGLGLSRDNTPTSGRLTTDAHWGKLSAGHVSKR